MASNNSTLTLSGLPLELRAQILAHADLKTIFVAGATCKALHEAVEFNAPYILASAHAKTMAKIMETHGKVVSYDSHTSIIKAVQDFATHRPCIQRPCEGRQIHFQHFANQYVENTLNMLDPPQSLSQSYERWAKVEIMARNLVETCRPKAFEWCDNTIRADFNGLLLSCHFYSLTSIRRDYDQLCRFWKAGRSFLGVPISHPAPDPGPSRSLLTAAHFINDDDSEDTRPGLWDADTKPWGCKVDQLVLALSMPLPSLGRGNFSYCVYSKAALGTVRALLKGDEVGWRRLLMVVNELHIY